MILHLYNNTPFDEEQLRIAARKLVNVGIKAKWYEKLLCKLFGHPQFLTVWHYKDVTDENSKVIWLMCKRCGLK